VIRGAELNDSGLYDCYDGEGLRTAGYQLFVAGMNSWLWMWIKGTLYFLSGRKKITNLKLVMIQLKKCWF